MIHDTQNVLYRRSLVSGVSSVTDVSSVSGVFVVPGILGYLVSMVSMYRLPIWLHYSSFQPIAQLITAVVSTMYV